jgi:2'-5' RNA ligase
MKRTFLAVKTVPGDKMKDCIFHIKSCLKGEQLKWVRPTQLHLTLAFLGDTSLDQIQLAGQMISRIVPGYDAPVIQYRGLGLFRSIRDPRVLWIGLDIDPVLRKLKAELDRELRKFGFRIEHKDFKPHLTLARIKWLEQKETLRDLLQVYKDYYFQESTVRDLTYFESILSHRGPTYKVIKKVGFKYAAP